MTDIVTPDQRSKMMAGIRAKNTKPELLIRRALFAQGLRFRLHRRDLPGVPDIVFPGRKIVVFVHGCFWHQHPSCRFAKLPSSNTNFWRNKLEGNTERDERAAAALLSMGWRVLTVWECATRNPLILKSLGLRIREWIDGAEPKGEIPKVDDSDY